MQRDPSLSPGHCVRTSPAAKPASQSELRGKAPVPELTEHAEGSEVDLEERDVKV